MSTEAKFWIVLLVMIVLMVVVVNEASQWERIRRVENIQSNASHWMMNIYHENWPNEEGHVHEEEEQWDAQD